MDSSSISIKWNFSKIGELIELSKTEQKLLKVLCENRGKVVKREYLIERYGKEIQSLWMLML